MYTESDVAVDEVEEIAGGHSGRTRAKRRPASTCGVGSQPTSRGFASAQLSPFTSIVLRQLLSPFTEIAVCQALILGLNFSSAHLLRSPAGSAILLYD